MARFFHFNKDNYNAKEVAVAHVTSDADISLTNIKAEQIRAKRSELIVEKDELITYEISEKVSTIYH